MSRSELESPGSFAILRTNKLSTVCSCSEETKAFLAKPTCQHFFRTGNSLYSFTLQNQTIGDPGAYVSDVSNGFFVVFVWVFFWFFFCWDKLQEKQNSQNYMKLCVIFCILLVLLYLHEVRKEDGRRKLLIWYKNLIHAPMVITVIPSWNNGEKPY